MSASFFSLKRGLAAGGAVLVLGGSAVGIASAQTAPAGTPSTTSQTPRPGYQAFLDALAKRLNISSSTLQTAIDQARTDAGLPAGGGFGHEGDPFRAPRKTPSDRLIPPECPIREPFRSVVVPPPRTRFRIDPWRGRSVAILPILPRRLRGLWAQHNSRGGRVIAH